MKVGFIIIGFILVFFTGAIWSIEGYADCSSVIGKVGQIFSSSLAAKCYILNLFLGIGISSLIAGIVLCCYGSWSK